MAEKDKRDEIISMQLDLIRQMTQNNIRRLTHLLICRNQIRNQYRFHARSMDA